jgi:hypothetical protein
MPRYTLDGKERSRLREAILAGFDPDSLNSILRDNNRLQHNIALGPDFITRVNSLIDIADQEGWLDDLCTVLAAERTGNELVSSAIEAVRTWIIEHQQVDNDPLMLKIVLSSVETDSAWKENFESKGRFFEAVRPHDNYVDTVDRLKQSRDNAAGVLRSIDDAHLFVAIVSRRYIRFPQAAAEFDRALARMARAPGGGLPVRRMLALTLDQESRDWVSLKKQEELDSACRHCLLVEDFWDGKNRKSIYSNGATDDAVVEQILRAGEGLRADFNHLLQPDRNDVPPRQLPAGGLGGIQSLLDFPAQGVIRVEPDRAVADRIDAIPDKPVPGLDSNVPGSIVILGEPKASSMPEAVMAAEELAGELAAQRVRCERWADGWRATGRNISELADRPVFVRTIVDKSSVSASDAASRLSAELNVAFGFQFDDESEAVRPLLNCLKILWRPNGPDWTPPARGPLLYSRVEQPSEFGRWLAKLLRIDAPAGSAIVHYEDPAAKGDVDNAIRRTVVEDCLMSAMTTEQPPLRPDSAPFGYNQLLDVINSLNSDALTVIAAHDLRTPPKSREATIERFREIDRRIDQTLASKHISDAPLMRVAVLLRNADQFPHLEFSRESRIRDWKLLRILKDADGTYRPDMANVERLREHAADLARRRPER